MKIVIADDVEIVRNGLKTIIEQDSELTVCGLAKDGNEAYSLCHKLLPDIILMDMQMPNCDGALATQKIKQDFPNIKVLVLTTFDDKQTVGKALASGADGYILKNVDESKLAAAIKSTVSGIKVLGADVFDNVKNRFITSNQNSNIDITEREKELLVLIADGLSNKEIAEKMFLSAGTVRNLVSALLVKLKLKDRTQLAVFAVKNDYI